MQCAVEIGHPRMKGGLHAFIKSTKPVVLFDTRVAWGVALFFGLSALFHLVVALPPMEHYPATQAAFGMLPADDCTHLTSFRLDDDDAMDVGHIARLRRMAREMTGVGVTPQRFEWERLRPPTSGRPPAGAAAFERP